MNAADFLAQAYAEHKAKGYQSLPGDFPDALMIPRSVALRAIELALQHAENYRGHLTRALRNARQPVEP